MNSLLQILRKPLNYAFSLYSSKTHQGVSPSLSAQKTSVLSSILSPFETYVVSLQSLLIWEKPYLSAGAFVTLNILYWLIVSWNRRFLSILSIFSLGLFLYKTWVNQIWPEIRVPPKEGEDTESWCTLNPGVLSVPELCKYLNDSLDKMIILWKDIFKLRKENHGLFCALMCGFFSLTGLIGIVFPGVLIIYFFVLLLTLGPGVALHLIPSTVYDQIIGYFSDSESQASKSPCISDKDSDLEEFVPEISPDIIRQLSLKDDVPEIPSPGVVLTESSDLAGDISFITESDDFSLYQGLGAFPSVEEEGESDIDEDISDIVPQAESEKIEIHFNPSHFKDSSESESEAAFTEGLSFSDTQEQKPSGDYPCPTATDLTAQEKSSKRKDIRKLSSDLEDELEDFELLDDSDIPSLK